MLKKSFKRFWEIPHNTLPALDGLRTIAILMVFLTHASHHFHGVTGIDLSIFRLPFIHSGWAGVDLFFVLSGYLIGLQLWRDLVNDGTVAVRRFFIKRTFRIWPLYFFYLFIFAIIMKMPLGAGKSLWPELFFVSNYFGDYGIDGSWSLSVEEQFYIFAPLMLIIFRKRSLSFHRKLLGGLVLLAPLIRVAQLLLVTGSLTPSTRQLIDHVYFPFHTHYDGLMLGLLLANVASDRTWSGVERLKRFWPWMIVLVVGFFARWYSKNIFNYTMLASMFGFALWYCLHYTSWVTKILSWRFFHYISKLSFGIYLVHQVVLYLSRPMLNYFNNKNELSFFIFIIITFSISLVVTSISYILVEAPFLNLRSRLLKRF